MFPGSTSVGIFRGAEEFYTRSNNRTRTEGLEQAVDNDIKVGLLTILAPGRSLPPGVEHT
jgi:hypothetical protein